MSAFRTLVGLGLASTMMITAPVFAAPGTTNRATPATRAVPATRATPAKPATPAVRATPAKPAVPAKKVAAVTPKAKITTPAKAVPARHGARLVTAKLSNGKTVTYDCSLAGNKTKQACKG